MSDARETAIFVKSKFMGLCSDAQGQFTPQKVIRSGRILKLIRDVIRVRVVVLVTCKNEGDPIKNEGARVATRLYVH